MSRKHYVEVAAILRGHIVGAGADEAATARLIAYDLAGMFARDNGAFDRGRFYTACGIDNFAGVPS